MVSLLWDSWEDGAEIRDAATGRFIDRDRLHYVDFTGTSFSVRGPSITPRPPQGQPVIAVAVPASGSPAQPPAQRVAERSADIALTSAEQASRLTLDHPARHRQSPLRVIVDIPIHRSTDQTIDQLIALAARPEITGARLVRRDHGTSTHAAESLVRTAGEITDHLVRQGLLLAAGPDIDLRTRFGLTQAQNRFLSPQDVPGKSSTEAPTVTKTTAAGGAA